MKKISRAYYAIASLVIVIGAMLIIPFTSRSNLTPEDQYADALNFRPYEISREQMISDIEREKDKVKANPAGFNPAFSSRLALSLARYYIHSGQTIRGLEEINDVTLLGQNNDVIQPYAGLLLQEIAAGQNDNVISQLKRLDEVREKIEWMDGNWQNYIDSQHPETATPKKERQKRYTGEHDLCKFAAKAFALKKDFAALERLYAETPCKDIHDYTLPALIIAGKYSDAYQKITQSQAAAQEKQKIKNYEYASQFDYSRSAGLLDACLPNLPAASDAAETERLQYAKNQALKEKNDRNIAILAKLLTYAAAPDDAQDLAKAIGDSELRNAAYISILDYYYAKNDREKALGIAQEMNLSDAAPYLHDNGWGSPSPEQWNNLPTRAAALWIARPGPLAFELTDMLKNPQTRFTVLRFLHMSLKDKPEIKMTGCEQTTAKCLMDKMEAIANGMQKPDPLFPEGKRPHFSSASPHDQMYATLTSLALSDKDTDSARKFYTQISNPNAHTCSYDMCMALVPNIPQEEKPLPDCAIMLKNSPESLFGRDKLKKSAHSRGWIDHYFSCNMAHSAFKSRLGAPSSDALNYYFRKILSALPNTIENLDTALSIVSKLNSERVNSYFELLSWITKARNPYMDGASEDVMKLYIATTEAVLKHPSLKNNSKLLTELLLRIKSRKNWKGKSPAQILSDHPDARKLLLSTASYHGPACQFMTNFLPKPGNFIKVVDDNGKNKFAVDNAFRECIQPLVRNGLYKEALYLSANMFPNTSMRVVGEQAVLDDLFSRENSSFADTSKQGNFGDEFLFISSSLQHRDTQIRQKYTDRLYGCPLAPEGR
ncbi:MAG: hypothetical protein JNM12_00185 [Alphaproteobacteria bacterium]|nr:hypothetical protein [Alphaproteobacteria bacterium]